MKRILLALSLLIVTILFVFLPLQAPSVSPRLMMAVESSQEVSSRQLELGERYERYGMLEQAQAAYEQAALSPQAEIASQAQAALERVLLRRSHPLYRLQDRLRIIAGDLIANGLPLLVLVTILIGLWALLTRLFTKPGYMILPFEDFTSDKVGAGLHFLINFFAQEAHQTLIHDKNRLLGLATLEFPIITTLTETHDALTAPLASLESVKVGGFALPFGSILLALRQWLGTREYTLSGALHTQGDSLRLYAEIRKVNGGKIVAHWELAGSPGEISGQVGKLAYELTYRFIFQISSLSNEKKTRSVGASDWRSLQWFTQGLQALQQEPLPGETSQLEQAVVLLNQAITLDPAYTAAQYALGIAYTRLGQYEKARQQFQAVIDRGKELVLEATYNKGLALYSEFKLWAYQEAEQCFKQVLEEIGFTRQTDPAALAQPSKRLLAALAHCGLANIYAQMIGEKKDYQTPPRSVREMITLAESHGRAALKLIDLSSIDEQTKLVQALQRNALGITYYQTGKLREAIRALEEAYQLFPNNPVAYGYIALTYLKQDKLDLAKEWSRRATQWQPASEQIEYVHYKIARYHQRQQNLELAEEYFLQAPRIPLAHYYLGEIYARQSSYDAAINEFRQAAALNEREALFWYNLAYYIAASGNLDLLTEAETAARRAVELSSGTRHEWLRLSTLSWILILRGKLDEAEAVLQRSIDVDSAGMDKERIRSQNYYHLALLYRARGQPAQALSKLDEALAAGDIKPKWREKLFVLKDELLKEQIS